MGEKKEKELTFAQKETVLNRLANMHGWYIGWVFDRSKNVYTPGIIFLYITYI